MKMKIKVLAVLALALLMINMAPVMKAEAAEDVQTNFDALYESQAYAYAQQYLEANRGDKDYYCIFVRDQYTGSYDSLVTDNEYSIVVVIGNNSALQVTEVLNSKTGAVNEVCIPSCGYSYVNGSAKVLSTTTTFKFQTSTYASVEHVYYLDGNMDIASVLSKYDKITVYDMPVQEPEYEYLYSATGPVAATWSADISNLMRFVGTELDDVDDLYVKSNWEAKYDDWFHRIIFRLGGELPALAGSSPTDGNMYKLYTESVIVFPSKDIVTGWISSGMSPVELYNDKGQANWFQTVYDGKNTFVKVKVTSESVPYYHSLMNGSHLFQVDIPMTNVIASVDESFDGGLRGYYGLSQEMWNLWKNSVYSYVLPYEIYTVLYAKEDVDTMVYGNMHYSVPNWTDIDPLGKGYVFTGGVIEKPLEDITEEDKKEIQMDTTREELAKRTEELEQLKKEYAESLKMNGSDEDVFELFGNFTSGLRSSSASFKNVATAVGNVFAFFPEDITGLLYGGIIVMIVIAIVKAIRG